MNLENKKFPSFIEIQTQSKCNGFCTTCPYGSIETSKKERVMSDEVIEKIILECDKHKNSIQRIIPYMNNEPSLDSRLINILRRIKREGHFIELSTNFSNISETQMKELVHEKLVDDLRISFFGGNKDFYNKMMPGLDFEENYKKVSQFIEINNNTIMYTISSVLCPWIDMEENIFLLKALFPLSQIHLFGFLDRAGNNVKYKNNLLINDGNKWEICGCELNRPFERMVILADGNVIICSQDWNEEEILGNIKSKSIEEIWNGDSYLRIREILNGQIKIPISNFICSRCKLAKIRCKENIKTNFLGDKYISSEGIKKII